MMDAEIDRLIRDAIAQGVFPGAVALVWSHQMSAPNLNAWGNLADLPCVPERVATVTTETVFDLASLTKVLCTTTLVAIAVARGMLDLADALPRWAGHAAGARCRDLLEHVSGLPAHREFFSQVAPFDREAVLGAVKAVPLERAPGEGVVYSDLGFILLGAWMEELFGGPLDVLFRREIADPLGIPPGELDFRPLPEHLSIHASERTRIAPSEVYRAGDRAPATYLSLRAAQGYAHGVVHDDNAFVMGGIAGHAGLFGTASSVLRVARAWLDGELGISRALRDTFWTPSEIPESTRCLGFDGATERGSGLQAHCVGHLGFTGTSLWIDPHVPAVYILLTHRVHRGRGDPRIRSIRRAFHRLAAATLAP